MTKSIKDENLIFNSVMVDGFIMPISSLSEEYQKITIEAREKGGKIQFWTK